MSDLVERLRQRPALRAPVPPEIDDMFRVIRLMNEAAAYIEKADEALRLADDMAETSQSVVDAFEFSDLEEARDAYLSLRGAMAEEKA